MLVSDSLTTTVPLTTVTTTTSITTTTTTTILLLTLPLLIPQQYHNQYYYYYYYYYKYYKYYCYHYQYYYYCPSSTAIFSQLHLACKAPTSRVPVAAESATESPPPPWTRTLAPRRGGWPLAGAPKTESPRHSATPARRWSDSPRECRFLTVDRE